MVCITAQDPDGGAVHLVDGGLAPWARRLLANAKERLVVSGVGLGLIAARWPGARGA